MTRRPLAAILLVAAPAIFSCGAQSPPGESRAGGSEATPGPNRLAKESSPYLLLHAENPVDWYPWGEEALARTATAGRASQRS